MTIAISILIGLLAGILSGLIGVGGGVILIPAFIYLFGMTQHQAQGTTLALFLPPIGLLAFLTYYRQGYVNVPVAAFVCIGFFIGGLFGAKFAVAMSNEMLRKVFGVSLFLVSLQLIFSKT